MGKKYEAYQQAVQAQGMADNRFSDVQGGSTKDAYQEAQTNAVQARANTEDTWNQFINDPEG